MGLLDGAMAQQQPMQGGQFGAMPGGQAQAGGGLQMAQQLAANPTPEMAQQIIQKLKQSGSPEADQLDQILQQTGGDPAKIKQVAEFVIQHLSQQ